jgi:hypothetical protein
MSGLEREDSDNKRPKDEGKNTFRGNLLATLVPAKALLIHPFSAEQGRGVSMHRQ